MGFSNFMGLMGGMARAGEQVADQTLARMDASAIAKAREEAQIRLEQRTEQAAIAREGRGYKREDFTYKRGLMDDKAKIADARQARLDEEARTQDPAYIAKVVAAKNQEHTGLIAGQESSAKNKADVNKTSAETEKLKAEVAKIKKESEAIGAGGGITEPQTMARLSVGADMIKARFGMKLDKTGFMMDDSAIQDREGMDKALVLYENRVRAGEQPYAAYESVIKEYNGVASATKAASDERAQRGINNLNENKPILRFKDYTREEFDALPKEEQDKAINQSKAPSAPKQSTPATTFAPITPQAAPKGKIITAPDGTKYISTGTGLKPYTEPAKQEPARPVEIKKPTGLMGQANTPSNVPVEVDSEVAQAEAEVAQVQKEMDAFNQKVAANEARRKNENGNIAPANNPKLVTKQYENASKAINAKIDEALAKKDFAAADVEYKKLSRAGEIANKQLEIKKLTDTLNRLGSGHETDKKDIRARIAKLKAEM